MAYDSHGNTPAAWTTVVVIMAGFVVAGIGVINLNWPLFWLGGAGLVVVGGIVGKVMQMMGLGQLPRPVASGDDDDLAVAGESAGG